MQALKGKHSIASIVAVVALGVLAVSVAWAGDRAKTRVTIDAAFRLPGETQWAGDIFSPRKRCKNNRLVSVFLDRPGADEKIGSTRSYKGTAQPGYFWVLSQQGGAPNGNYYAKVKRTRKCKADRSEAIPIE
jgi:hypothetical protein